MDGPQLRAFLSFRFLEPKALGRAAQACKGWRLAEQDGLWRELCRGHWATKAPARSPEFSNSKMPSLLLFMTSACDLTNANNANAFV